MASAVCEAVWTVTGSNSFLPIRASPVDNDSYCGSKDSPSTAGTRTERGAVLDAEFVEGLGDVESHAVGLVQFVSDAGLQPGETATLELVVEQLDDVVDENLDRHRCRVHLRDEVFATYDRNRASGRK